MTHQQLLARLAHSNDRKVVLLVLDGVGDIRTEQQPRTALEAAHLPNLDALAERSALGRIVPVATGIIPGSGPGHLALFGYDPTTSEADIGRASNPAAFQDSTADVSPAQVKSFVFCITSTVGALSTEKK